MHCACWPMLGEQSDEVGQQSDEVGLTGVPLCSKLGACQAVLWGWSGQDVELSGTGCVSAMPLYNAGSNMPTRT